MIEGVVAKLNQQCQQKFEEEKQHLQPLPKYRVPDYEMLTARVSSRSTVEVRCVLYTVPSRLIGRQLELRLYHDRILGYLGNHQVVDLPRVRVTDESKRRGRCINYRHVIEGLRRKPRAFSASRILRFPQNRERHVYLLYLAERATAHRPISGIMGKFESSV